MKEAQKIIDDTIKLIDEYEAKIEASRQHEIKQSRILCIISLYITAAILLLFTAYFA